MAATRLFVFTLLIAAFAVHLSAAQPVAAVFNPQSPDIVSSLPATPTVYLTCSSPNCQDSAAGMAMDYVQGGPCSETPATIACPNGATFPISQSEECPFDTWPTKDSGSASTITLTLEDAQAYQFCTYFLPNINQPGQGSLSAEPSYTVRQCSVSLSASPSSGTAPLSVTFTATPSSGCSDITSYFWTFGDGNSWTTQTNSEAHTYTSSGTYTPSVSVTATGGPYKASTSVTVSGSSGGGEMQLAFSPGTPLAPGSSMSITSTCIHGDCTTGSGTSWLIYTGSVNSCSSQFASWQAMGEPSCYSVNLNIANPPCLMNSESTSVSAQATVTVGSASPEYLCGYANAISTDASVPEYSIPTGNVVAPSSSSGCSLVLSESPSTGNPPLTVVFTAALVPPMSGGACTSPTSYSWTFGDGNTGTTTTGTDTDTYVSAGTYTPSVTATGSGGPYTASNTVVVTALPTNGCTVMITSSTSSGPAPLYVSFTATPNTLCTGPYTYSWAFGDGGTSTSQNPAHTYAAAGSYSAAVTMDYGSGSGSGSVGATTPITASKSSGSGSSGTGSGTTGVAAANCVLVQLISAYNVVQTGIFVVGLLLMLIGGALYAASHILPGQTKGTLQGYAMGMIMGGVAGVIIAILAPYIFQVITGTPASTYIGSSIVTPTSGCP